MDGSERRLHPRLDIVAQPTAAIDPSPEDGVFEAVLKADLVDVSSGGAGLAMRQPLVPATGARFEVQIAGQAPRMAEVAWSRAEDDGLVRLGLRFL